MRSLTKVLLFRSRGLRHFQVELVMKKKMYSHPYLLLFGIMLNVFFIIDAAAGRVAGTCGQECFKVGLDVLECENGCLLLDGTLAIPDCLTQLLIMKQDLTAMRCLC